MIQVSAIGSRASRAAAWTAVSVCDSMRRLEGADVVVGAVEHDHLGDRARDRGIASRSGPDSAAHVAGS